MKSNDKTTVPPKTLRKRFVKKVKKISVDQIAEELLNHSRTELARAITLIESIRKEDREEATNLLDKVLPHTGNSIRIGVSGVPGAGKSTFIEQFGWMLCELGYRVAVLAIDPSSTKTGGSILGDKTRMEKLSSHPNAFIRPSPSSGTLGGVHEMTRETMILCEAAGYEVILIETVGVGQSEVAVRNMTDFFMLLVLTGAGDDLQGMKKGIMEMVDAFIVHKADGDNLRVAKRTIREYKRIVHFLDQATPGWDSVVLPVSSLENTGHEDVWKQVENFKKEMKKSGYWDKRRQEQNLHWFHDRLRQRLIDDFLREKSNKNKINALEGRIQEGDLSIAKAMEQLFDS